MKSTVNLSKKLHELTKAEWASPLFKRYGEFVARNPCWLIAASILLTMCLSLGVLRLHMKDDLRFMYTPPNSPSFNEFHVHKSFQKAQNLSYSYVYVAVVAPDGGNLLTEDISQLVLKANAYVFDNLTVTNFFGSSRERVNFGQDLCPRLPLCADSNRMAEVFLQAYFDPDDGYSTQNLSKKNNTGDSDPKNAFTYPVATIYRSHVFLASHFYNVKTAADGSLNTVGLVHLTYLYPIRYDDDQESMSDFQSALERHFTELEAHHPSEIHFYIYSMNKLQKEVAQNTFRTLPYLPVSVIILVLYTLWTTITWSNPITSKPMEGFMGVGTTLLAVISAYGLVFACGIPYNSTVAVVPFLTLALAVDDTYIMLAAWRETNSRLSAEKRLGEAMSNSGCAITVAMLTDVFAFVVGAFSNTPAIEHFCLFIAAAVSFDYIYQLTFFSAFLAISGRREQDGRHCIMFWRPADQAPIWRSRKIAPVPCSSSRDASGARKASALCCRSDPKHPSTDNYMQNFLKRYYSSVLMNAQFRIFALILYLFYVCVSFWGCIKLGVNLTPAKLLMRGSELDRYSSLLETYIWPEGLMSIVYVQNAPDFDFVEERNRFDEFVQALESTPFSLGPQSTSLWLKDYTSFLNYLDIDADRPGAFYESLPSFLKLNDYQRWKRYLHLSNQTVITNQSRSISESGHLNKSVLRVDSFFFTTGFRLEGWSKLLEMVHTWRGICKNYSEYQPVVFEDNNFYADQIASLAPNVIQDTGIAFFCMIAAVALFIPNALILFWVTWSLFSMNLGVVGLLSLWGCDLDPTAVISILLSIGLTVDFTIHVAYHYHKSCTTRLKKLCRAGERAARRRVLEETLLVAGWPLVQGGLSTTLAVVALFFVPSYVIGVFLRTVLLVVLLGILHALVYLPMLLTSVTLDRSKRNRMPNARGRRA